MEITVYHNPSCSTCRTALGDLDACGVAPTVIEYLKTPPTKTELRKLLAIFQDDPRDLVRRDAFFAELGLTEAEVQSADEIVNLLATYPRLLQRPIVVIDGLAYLGRPKGRVAELLAASK